VEGTGPGAPGLRWLVEGGGGEGMTHSDAVVLYLAVCGAVVLAVTGGIGRLRATRRTPVKDATYECGVSGERGVGPRFPVRFYVIAMLFVILDVEAIAFYPWGVRLRALGPRGALDMAVFAVVIAVGYAYVWKKKGLDWR
jgi:NADH-quinone oxidoreductase subunit A